MKNTNLSEIYMREPGDINYVPNILHHSSALETFIGKIKMILNTTPGEVIGFPDFGAGLEALIFSLNANEHTIKEKIMSQISTFCTEAPYFEINIEVKFFKGSYRDIALIDIIIDGTKEFGILLK